MGNMRRSHCNTALLIFFHRWRSSFCGQLSVPKKRQKISCHQSGPLSPGRTVGVCGQLSVPKSPVGVYVHLKARSLLWANAVLHVEPGLVQPHVTFQSNVIVSVSNPRVAKQVKSKRRWRRWRRLIKVHFLAAGCAEQVSSFYIRLCSS